MPGPMQSTNTQTAEELLEQFHAALAAETAARDAMRHSPRDTKLVQEWLRAMDVTHDASKKLHDLTRK